MLPLVLKTGGSWTLCDLRGGTAMGGSITSRKAWLSVEWIRSSMSWFSVKPFSSISILLQQQTESDGLSPNQGRFLYSAATGDATA